MNDHRLRDEVAGLFPAAGGTRTTGSASSRSCSPDDLATGGRVAIDAGTPRGRR